MLMALAFPLMIACGGDDDGGGSSGNGGGGNGGGGNNGNGGGTPTATFNIIGTWRAYYQSNGRQICDLVRFNADHTGYIIEEVGNGTDYENPIIWTQTGNVIKVTLDGNYVITWTIQQIIDDNTVIISDGKREYNVIRDGTGGGPAIEFVSKGGGSLSVAQLLGTWQVYHVDGCASENGQAYTRSEDVYPGDQYGLCQRYEFYTDYTYKSFDYYNGSWSIPHGPYNFQVVNGYISLPDEGGTPSPEYCRVTANKTNSEEIVITMHYTKGDQYMEYLLKRVEGGGTTSGFVSQGGGSLSIAQLVGTWQSYHVELCELDNGKPQSYAWDVYPKDSYASGEPPCQRLEFNADYTYNWHEYNAGSWDAHGPFPYQVVNGGISMTNEIGAPPLAESCWVTTNKSHADEIVITMHFTTNDRYIEYLLKRVEDSGSGDGGGTVQPDSTLYEEPYLNWGASRATVKTDRSAAGYTLMYEYDTYISYEPKFREEVSWYSFDDSGGLSMASIQFDASTISFSALCDYVRTTLGAVHQSTDLDGTMWFNAKDGKALIFVMQYTDGDVSVVYVEPYNSSRAFKGNRANILEMDRQMKALSDKKHLSDKKKGNVKKASAIENSFGAWITVRRPHF